MKPAVPAAHVNANDNMPSDHDPHEPQANERPGARFMLWVDGVGGYLVCQGDVISLGQPVQGSYIDVPVLGDISRLHARIRRDGECYLLEPVRETRVDGRVVEGVTILTNDCLIELGDGVRIRFRRPNPLSRTARLDFVSRHRTQPRSDGVLLMAESCILGPGSGAHVRCPDWTQEVMLYAQGEKLLCRTPGQFRIDGIDVTGNATVGRSSQIVGDQFSLSLESV